MCYPQIYNVVLKSLLISEHVRAESPRVLRSLLIATTMSGILDVATKSELYLGVAFALLLLIKSICHQFPSRKFVLVRGWANQLVKIHLYKKLLRIPIMQLCS